jgi:hypothetical protein
MASEVIFMWVPHMLERADFETRQATLGNMVYNAQSVARDLLPIPRMLDEWQKSWEVAETERFSHSLRNGGRKENL